MEIERLYRQRYAKFLRVALAIVGDENRARDAVQDGFASGLRAAGQFEGDFLEGWIWRIVVNAALAERRRSPGWEPLGEIEQVSREDFDVQTVREWITELPERQRLVIFLRYYADLDYRSVAAALEIEVGTVSATLSQAHTALRKQLKEVER